MSSSDTEGEGGVGEINVPDDNVSVVVPPPSSSGGRGGGGPFLCFTRFAGDAAGGALLGSVVGYGSGLIKRRALKDHSLMRALVPSLVSCLLKRVRGKDDDGLRRLATGGIAQSLPTPRFG